MMKSKNLIGASALFCAGMMQPVFANAQQGADKVLHEGERMIAQCLNYAASQKYPAMSVAVVDASGTLVAFKRQDDASPATADATLLKAKTALRLNAPTAELGPAIANDPSTRDAFLILQLTTLPGGMPVTDEAGRIVGAIGVSGGGADQDAECARQAAAPAPAKKK